MQLGCGIAREKDDMCGTEGNGEKMEASMEYDVPCREGECCVRVSKNTS